MAVAGDTVYAGGEIGYVGARTGALAMFGAAAQHPQRGWPVILGGDASAAFVQAVVSDGSGGWIVGGSFTTVGGYPCPRLARITRDRRLDRRFCIGPNGGVHALAVRGKTVFVGGDFLRIGGAARVRLAAVGIATGKLLAWRAPVTGRPSWDRDDKISPSVWALAVAGDTLVVGGFFERVGGEPRANLAAVDAVTARPRPWRPTGNARYPDDAPVYSLGVYGDTVYVAGAFDKLAGESAAGVGAVDVRTGSRVRWRPRISMGVRYGVPEHLTVARDRVYFTRDNGAAIVAVTRDSGSLVATFNVPRIGGENAWISALAVGPRTLYLGGEFTRIGKRDVSNLAAVDLRSGRVLPWAPPANSDVHALAVANGTLAVGGALTSAGGTRRDGLVAVERKHRQAASLDSTAGRICDRADDCRITALRRRRVQRDRRREPPRPRRLRPQDAQADELGAETRAERLRPRASDGRGREHDLRRRLLHQRERPEAPASRRFRRDDRRAPAVEPPARRRRRREAARHQRDRRRRRPRLRGLLVRHDTSRETRDGDCRDRRRHRQGV